MIGTSPPGPLRCGSTTRSVKAAATPASKALPPFSRILIPTAVAIQCVEVTTPKVPSISGLVVKGSGLILLITVHHFAGIGDFGRLTKARATAIYHCGIDKADCIYQEIWHGCIYPAFALRAISCKNNQHSMLPEFGYQASRDQARSRRQTDLRGGAAIISFMISADIKCA